MLKLIMNKIENNKNGMKVNKSTKTTINTHRRNHNLCKKKQQQQICHTCYRIQKCNIFDNMMGTTQMV